MASGNLKVVDASTGQKGAVALAIASEVDAGTSTTKAISPSALADSKRTPIAFARFGSINAISLGAKLGVSSISKVGSSARVTLAETQPNTDYVVTLSGTAGPGNVCNWTNPTTSGFDIYVQNTGGGVTDATNMGFIMFGDK